MINITKTVSRAFYGNFSKLQPIQREAIEPILRGSDVLVLSGTGSGKTEAVTVPLVDRYLSEACQDTHSCILFITPTRALANDLVRRLSPPMDKLGLPVGVRHGERNDLLKARKPYLLITTPESLDVMLTAHEPSLQGIRAVILDEVHLTYNTQRGFQLAVLLKRLESFNGCPIQVVGLSATVARASDIWQFFRPGHELVTIQDSLRKPLDYHIVLIQTGAELLQLVNTLAEGRKTKILLFTDSRRECDRLAATLRGATCLGPNIFVHHSSLSRDIRLETERAFQESASALCVATSTLELGIDIGDIDVIMLYGHPGGWESFLQRVGRGNRRSNKTNVVCLVTPEHGHPFLGTLAFEALVSQIRDGELECEAPLDIYGAAAQQILSVLLEHNGAYCRVAELSDLLSAWIHLPRSSVEQLLNGLAAANCVQAHGFQNRYGAREELYRLRDLRLIWGNFPARSRDIRLMVHNHELGSIPASNLLRIRTGAIIRFAARNWQVRGVRPETIDVEPSSQSPGLEITYGGEKPPIDPGIVGQMLKLLEAGAPMLAMSATERKWFDQTTQRLGLHVCGNRIPLARDQSDYCYLTFAGKLVNGVVARWARLSSFDAGDIMLRAREPINFSSLPTDPGALQSIAIEVMQIPDNLTIFQSLLPVELLELELIDIWLKTPIFARSLKRLRQARVAEVPMAEVVELLA